MKNILSLINKEKKVRARSLRDVANLLGVQIYDESNFERLSDGGLNASNRFLVRDDAIFFYPPNDGMSTCPFEFYKNGERIITNQRAFEEISNLDYVILEMVRVFDKALDNGIVLDPYAFILRLDNTSDNNKFTAKALSITESTVWNHKLTSENFDIAASHFINKFLDHFIGWNFGVSVNRNDELMDELGKLNEKVIDMGMREFAGRGCEVFGSDDEVYQGVQHYSLPIYKVKVKTRVRPDNDKV